MSSQYEYTPLVGSDAIRLLEIKPASDPSAEIHCSLTHTTLSKCDNRDIFGNYTALSYVWGSPEKVKAIYVDGMSVGITANLFSALTDLRDDTRSLWLWVDAVCINQIDHAEKGAQIRMMGQIYAGARHTVIYLGPGGPDGREPLYLASLSANPHTDTDSELLESLTKKEWFTRVWVFQELVFSADPWIQCGRSRVKWHVLCTASHSAGLAENMVSSMEAARESHHAQVERNDRRGNESNDAGIYDKSDAKTNKKIAKNSILEILEARRGLKVTDPRDMLFAHFGFAFDSADLDITIDYSKPCFQTYKIFAQWVAKRHGLARVLEYVSGDNSAPRFKDLASWVPNWLDRGPMNYSYNRDTGVHASVTIPSWVQNQNNEIIATFPIATSDTIVSVTSALVFQNISSDFLKGIRDSFESIGVEGLTDFESDHLTELLQDIRLQIYPTWRELVRDDSILPPQPVSLDQTDANIAIRTLQYEAFKYKAKQHSRRGLPISWDIQYSVLVLLLIPFCIDYENCDGIADRALARMASGKLALVPVTARKGDVVVPLVEKTPWCHDRDPIHVKTSAQMESFVQKSVEQAQYLFRPVKNENLSESTLEKIRKSVNAGQDWPIVPCEYVGGCFLDTTPSHQVRDTDEISKPFIMTLD